MRASAILHSHFFHSSLEERDADGERHCFHPGREMQGVRLLRGVLSHQGPRALLRVQLQGLSPSPDGQPRKVQWVRSMRHVLPRFRDLWLAPARGKGDRRCTLIPPAFSPARILSMATTPPAKAHWLPARVSPPAIPLRLPPK